MANQVDSENAGSIDMEVDAIRSYSERVDSLIRSETASFYGDSPLYTLVSRVDSAIRSSFASYEADYEAHSSTTTNVHSQELSLQQSHDNRYYETHFRRLCPHRAAQRMRWIAALHSRFVQLLSGHPSKGMNSKDGSKEENVLNGLSGMVSSPSMLLTPHREDEILQPNNLKIFPFKDLKTATRNFRPDCVLGEGDSGTVFKGWIDEKTFAPTIPGTGMIIAVKRLNQELRCQEPSELLGVLTFNHSLGPFVRRLLLMLLWVLHFFKVMK
ncbi:hypothetical protein Fmac_014593 [Flemingia macrophylla]|uniref:Protein kinase domain-containing protein n=1 Tax=Flemingia macrophylla TaxID=520843 RepID=A0ABD1ME52_9FABA